MCAYGLELAVVPDHAVIVVRIFTLVAGGKGLRRVLHALNAEGIVNPSGKAWSVSKERGPGAAPPGLAR